MEVNEIRKLINSLNTVAGTENKGFLKTLAKNKFVVGSAIVSSSLFLFNSIKDISVSGIASSILPKQLFNVSLGGLPLGAMSAKLLSIGVAGVIISEIVKVSTEIKQGKSTITDILLKEFVSLIIMIFGLALLGKLGLDMIGSVNSLSIPAF